MAQITLSEMLAELREELLAAEKGKTPTLKLLVEQVEIELQVVTENKAGGGGGVKFWVYNADAKVEAADAKTQKFKLTLKPVHAEDDSTWDVGDQDELQG